MDSGMQPPAGEAEILKLFNQFLQANGKQFDINQLNIELKISQKMPGMTTDCDTKGKPQVVEPLNTLPAESTPVPLNPALTHTTQDIQPPADKMSVSTPAIDQLKTLTSDQGFSMSEALSPIPLQRADTLENDKAMSQHRDNRPQEVLSCNRGRSSKEGSQAERLSEGADGAARMTTFRTVIRTSIHPHPADPDSNRSVNSDNTQPELMDAARKDNLLSLKMEELYLKELNSIVRESEIHFQGSSTSRSYIGTLPQKKAKIRRTKTIGKSSSTKNLKEYVKSREMGDLIENGMANPVLIINVLGEHVSLRKRLSNSGLLLPKLKSAAPIMNHATYKDKNSPADNEDDTLRKHFGEVSVLNEEDPSAIESSPHKSDEIDVFKTPEDSGELNYKLSTKKTDTPMKMYPKEDEIIDDEQDYKKKTKISYMMQQSNEDDGCDLLGLLETTHPNGGLFSKYKSTDQRSDNKSDRFDVRLAYLRIKRSLLRADSLRVRLLSLLAPAPMKGRTPKRQCWLN